jgi:hypothetical protein
MFSFTLGERSNACNTKKCPMTSRRTRGHPNVFGHFKRQKMVPRWRHISGTISDSATWRWTSSKCVVTWKGTLARQLMTWRREHLTWTQEKLTWRREMLTWRATSAEVCVVFILPPFARMSLGTRLCFATHHALTARCPPRCHGSLRTVSSCSYGWTSPCRKRRYSWHVHVIKYVFVPCT